MQLGQARLDLFDRQVDGAREVGAVEDRTLRISNALGLDVSFFKSDDPAGNLKEFNSTYEGEVTLTDQALNAPDLDAALDDDVGDDQLRLHDSQRLESNY